MKSFSLLLATFFLISTSGVLANSKIANANYGIAISSDKEQIAYSFLGKRKNTLVFIHGWSLDSRLWQNQLAYFSTNHNVITIDLAGHGNSSYNRGNYTLPLFANDIKAVLKKENIDSAILIGHSMGGAVVAEAAKLMPSKIKGIIGVDTLHDVAVKISQAQLDTMAKPFEDDFQESMRFFVSEMLPKDVDNNLLYWVKEDMASAPKETALNQFRNYLGQSINGDSYKVFENIKIPVVLINAKLWPTNSERNKKYIKKFSAYLIEGTGHFPMIEKPEAFNKLLEKAIKSIN